MPSFCLPKYIVDKFIAALKDGTINPEKMMGMNSMDRRAFLAQFVGAENAPRVNALYESKLLLKDQQQGMITWAKNVAGISPKVRKGIIEKINKLEEVLTPETEDAFLEDLVAQKLGVTVTLEESANIATLAREATNAKEVMGKGPRRSNKIEDIWNATDTEMDYGRKADAFREYIGGLKEDARRVRREDFQADPVGTSARVAKAAAAVWKSLKSTLDQSVIGRQGWKVLGHSPKMWLRLAKTSMADAYKTLGGQNVMRELNAAIMSHPDYENMIKDKVAITTIEEEFPGSDLLEKIPAFGTVHKAAENSFKSFIYRTRVEAYVAMANLARDAGIKDVTGRGYGMYANSLGSRGNIGRLESLGDTINITFFSLRKLKSDLDFLTAHQLHRGKVDPIVRKQALKDLVGAIAVTTAALALAGAMGSDVEKDPTSSDFGKARVGDTTFDFTGGMGSMVVLAARLLKGSIKTRGGEKIPIRGPKAGYIKSTDMVWNYFENKFSPPIQFARNLLNWQTWEGEPLTFEESVADVGLPLFLEAIREAWSDPKAANLLLILLAEQAGVSANTYRKKQGYPKGIK